MVIWNQHIVHELVKTVRADLPEFIANLEQALQSWPD